MSENIKMIICDVDGTLLKKGEEKLQFQAVDAINRLIDKGIVFAAASGRSYTELKKIFGGVGSRMYYICFDGALAVKEGETVFQIPMDKGIPEKLCALKKEGLVFCGKNKNSEVPEDLAEIYKVVMPNELSFARTCSYVENNRLLKAVYRGKEWVEYASPSADKAAAICFLQKSLGISREETAAFGDNYNDVGMLRCAMHSYAVADATAEIKMLARYKTDDVIQEIIKNWL